MTSFLSCQEIDEELTILSAELWCKRVTDVQWNSIHFFHAKLTLFIQSGARLNFKVTLFANGTLYHNGKWKKNYCGIRDDNIGHLSLIIKTFDLIAAI